MTAAQQLTLSHVPSQPGQSRLDTRDWTRETFRAAYSMARRVIVERRNHGIGAAWTYYLLHARKRFRTPAAWRLAQLAGKIVFERRTPGHAASGQTSDLHRQGLVTAAGHPTRCISVE